MNIRRWIKKEIHIIIMGTFDSTRNESGNLDKIIFIGEDLTDHMQMEKALRESEERYRLVAENASDNIWLLRLSDLKFTYISPSCMRIFGFTPEESIEMPIPEHIPPESLKMVMDILEGELERESSSEEPFDRYTTFEIEQFKKDGSLIWTEVRASFIRDENGMPTSVLGITRDISERKKTENRLKESEERYRKLVENSLQGLVIAQDDPLRLSFANEPMEWITGYTPVELMNSSPDALFKLIHPDDRKKFFENFRKRLKGEKIPPQYHYRLIDKSGETRWVELYSSRTEYMGSPATQTVFLDVTDRKLAEDEKMKLEEQLRQSLKMEAVGRLAGGIAHDFNNLLTGINGYSDIIMESCEPGDPILKDVEEIRNAGKRAAELTSQLLAFSRKQLISPKIVRPNEIIDKSLKMIRRIIGEDINLSFIPARKLGHIKADPTQIDQILVNLAVNARDAMPNGGTLTIETHNILLDSEQVVIHGQPQEISGEYIVLIVSDNGCGMSEGTQKHIFEPFYSTKAKDQGTGLGLSTVYGIVRQNNGFIRVYSKFNLGTSFKIFFPQTSGIAERLDEKKAVSIPGGNETILLVEDEDMVRRLTRKILTNQGYSVIEETNGLDAYQHSSKRIDQIDLLLTDVIMPNMNGRVLYEKLAELKSELKVLFISGYTEDVIAHHGVLGKDTHFLQKPFSPTELTRKIREMLDS